MKGGILIKHRYFKSHKKKHKKNELITILTLVCVLFVGFEVFRYIDPFQSLNPLNHEVTSGEKVIGDWIYDGTDMKGDLVFFNKGTPHIMPADSHYLALDGETVVIKEATSNSLVFEEPIETLPYGRIMLILVGVLLSVFLYFRKPKKSFRKTPMLLFIKPNKRRVFSSKGHKKHK